MKRTVQTAIVVVLMIAAVLISMTFMARAQHCTSICAPSGLANGQQVCQTHCIPVQPGVTHRYNGPSQAEQNYEQRAYEYELRRLNQENR